MSPLAKKDLAPNVWRGSHREFVTRLTRRPHHQPDDPRRQVEETELVRNRIRGAVHLRQQPSHLGARLSDLGGQRPVKLRE
jgi:hypothetical protein